ncbi:MAG: response regulator [Kiritimatiellaeota bacterium]|nr:response regulator [Kiritimatiellota bacterium]
MEKNTRILVVDDQKDLRYQLAKLLENADKKSETVSLVKQMRERLLGSKEEVPNKKSSSGKDDVTYVVDTAGQGQDALEMVKKANEDEKPYALMFLDMRMPPGWDGLETATEIRKADSNIEIVIMTAYADHDQAQIAEQVGMPEKMLYIKKPFQAEEIFQLALSLTSKWTIEQQTKQRKFWLENLLRGMSKIKSSGSAEKVYDTVLASFASFTQASSGFIIEYDDKASPKFVRKSVLDMKEANADSFIKDNETLLLECRTTQNFKGKYILPLKKDDFISVVVVENVQTSTDPEWYKLLSLLVMTASEVLNNLTFSGASSGARDTSSKLKNEIKRDIDGIRDAAIKLKVLAEDSADTKKLTEEIIKKADGVVKRLEAK